MTGEQRRLWVRCVLSHRDLTAAQKVVLIALETFADFADGTNARPGESKLAELSGLQPRAVRYALVRALELKLISRTASANPKRGLADTYRLLTTGTAMPVEPFTTGTVKPHHRHGDNSTTGMAMPPTSPGPLQDRGARENDGDDSTATAPQPHTEANLQSANSSNPRPRCARHAHLPDDDRGPNCLDCRDARRAAEQSQSTADAERARIRALIDRCPDCDQYGRLEDLTDCPRHQNFRQQRRAS